MEVSKVQLANGEVLVDLTEDSVTEETLAEGATAHDASGKKITGTMKSGGLSVQADWNQTDETAADFIKNKPFGEGIVEIIPETEVVGADMDGLLAVEMPALENLGFETEKIYVTFDGVDYICNQIIVDGAALYGNPSMFDAGEDTGEPFCCFVALGFYVLIVQDTETHSVKISATDTVKIDTRYYDRGSVFYLNFLDTTDIYLYCDAGLTQKATYEDVKNATSGAIVLKYTYYTTDFIMSVYPIGVEYDEEYCTVVCLGGSANKTLYYTAEYTPPTT